MGLDNVDVSDHARRGGFSGPLLSLESVSIRNENRRLVNGLSLVLGPEDILGVTGPDTEALRALPKVLTGTMDLETGHLRYRGEAIEGQSPARRRAAGLYVTHPERSIRPGRSALDEVMAGANPSRRGLLTSLLGRSSDGPDADDARRALDLVGLGERAWISAASLWGLDRTRLEIARALVTGAKVLVLDRPANGLGIQEGDWLREILDRLLERRLSVLLVDMDAETIMRVCPRVALLVAGRKILDDTPAVIRRDGRVAALYPHWAEEDSG